MPEHAIYHFSYQGEYLNVLGSLGMWWDSGRVEFRPIAEVLAGILWVFNHYHDVSHWAVRTDAPVF